MQKKKILVVEDDRHISELIHYNLERENFTVTHAFDGTDILSHIQHHQPDAIILDIMLPGMDGIEICRLIKQNGGTQNIPIIILTSKSEESDIIIGLQLGADDYMTKPFSPKILVARVKALIRRATQSNPANLEIRKFKTLRIDLLKHKVTIKEEDIALTTIEFAILEFLSRNPGRVYTRDQIMDNVWKEGKFILDRAVDVHIRGLRKKLSSGAEWIETVRGLGYRFSEHA